MSGPVITACAAALSAAMLTAGPAVPASSEFPSEDPMNLLVTKSGTRLRSDGRLFALYAAFNALGYDEAPVTGVKPFARRIFPAVRQEVRRRVHLSPETSAAWEQLLSDAPLDASFYEACALSPAPGGNACTGALTRLPRMLRDVWREGNLAGLYPAAALDARQRLRTMLPGIDGAEEALRRRLRPVTRPDGAPARQITVILNVLSARPASEISSAENARTVSVGDAGAAQEAFLFGVTRRLASALAADACPPGPDGSAFVLDDALASALAADALGMDASTLPRVEEGASNEALSTADGRTEILRLMQSELTPERICGQTTTGKKTTPKKSTR